MRMVTRPTFRLLPARLQELVARAKSCRVHLLLLLLATVMLGSACAGKRPVKVVYLNRPHELNPADKKALTIAMQEVANWDAGAQVIDHRVQSHSRGYTVSLLISSTFNDQGMPEYSKNPIRNVEINRAWEVTGYHISQ